MRRMLSLVLSVIVVVSAVLPISAAGVAVGQINGVARTQSGQQLAGQLARLRSLEVGHVANVTTTNASGQFSFSGLKAGIYVVELVSNGYVVGTSAPVVLTARDMTADSVAATAAGGAQAQAGALAGSFWASTAGIITVAAVAAGVIIAVVVAKSDESPAQ
jgi:hypothetical protein